MAANSARSAETWFGRASLLLACLGAGLIVMAVATPWHTDADAYFAGLTLIRAELYDDTAVRGGMDAFDQASRDFHALQDRYRTSKWLYADLGYAAFAWSLLALAVAVLNPRLAPDRRGTVVLPASLAAIGLLVVGAAASAIHPFERRQVPEWADTLAIPLMGAGLMGLMLLPVVLAFTLAPILLTRRAPASLCSVRGRSWLASVPVTLIYLAPTLLGLLCLATIPSAGGWALSTGGAILVWLLLNARAIWLGRTPEAPAAPVDRA
jgi:hypothetical protein